MTAGTLFADSKLALNVWFLAMHLITQAKNGISSLELSRQLGISQNSAWLIMHKLMQAMLERDGARQLAGRVQIDDAYWGGRRSGYKRGRGTRGKRPFVAAVETDAAGHPRRMSLNCVKGFRSKEIARWSRAKLAAGTAVHSDGLACFAAPAVAPCFTIHLRSRFALIPYCSATFAFEAPGDSAARTIASFASHSYTHRPSARTRLTRPARL